MTIRMLIEITEVTSGPRNEFGAGVLVHTEAGALNAPDSEGSTWVGLCLAINQYMRSRGCPEFNCMKPMKAVTT